MGNLERGGPEAPTGGMSGSEYEPRTERRILTCLVLDVVGSTDLLAGRLGPDRLKDELDLFFPSARSVVESFGGIVEKFLGDGLLAVFGLPQSHEDDPERALRAALACVRVAEEARSKGGHLSVRLAVETGEALVNVGVGGRDQEHGIVGICVNLASRLQEKAAPGEVIVGPSCHELVARLAELEGVGPFELKGLGPVSGWRLVRLLEAHATLRPEFVGRLAELDRLAQAYDRALSGHPTFVLVVGPPGQGKTRLVEEFVEPLRARIELLYARCRPDDERGSENPLRQLLQSDGPLSNAADFGKRLEPLIADPEERARSLRSLAHSAGIELAPELLQVRVSTRELEFVRGWTHYLEALSHRRPVVVRLEDVQWAEPSVIRLMSRLEENGSSRLLVIATTRPETLGAVALRPSPNLVQLDLGPLDPESANALARSVGSFDTESLERAQGNPLFLLELARSLVHPGTVPLTIQAAIGAHLDSLAPDDRSLLGSASVIGDEFQAREVASVTGRPPADVSAALARLSHLRYVAFEDGRFRFHHRLVRDVAYSRLSAADRLRLHARFAQEGLPVQDVEAVAHHWWVAMGSPESEWVWKDDPDRALFRQEAFNAQLASARRHFERAASDRALEVARRAVSLAIGGEEAAQAEGLIADIHALRGEGDEAWSGWHRVIDAYQKADLPVPAQVYVRMVRQACWIWGTFRQLPKPEEVVALIDEGSRIARASGNALALANLLICRRGFLGSAPELSEVLDAAQSNPDLSAVGELLVELATVQTLEGDLAASLATCDRVDLLIGRGAKVDEHQTMLWRFLAQYHAGDLAAAEAAAKRSEGLMPSQNPHYQSHTLGMLSCVAAAHGQWEELKRLSAATEKLATDNPSRGFCLVGAGALAWGSVAEIVPGGQGRETLEPLVNRMVPESGAIRASVLFLPSAMVGQDRWLRDAQEAFQMTTQFWNRQEWDPFGVNVAVGLTVLERWGELAPYLERLDRVGAHGGRLCAALRDAILEEQAGAHGGPTPRHVALRGLGYKGLSDLLSFRPSS